MPYTDSFYLALEPDLNSIFSSANKMDSQSEQDNSIINIHTNGVANSTWHNTNEYYRHSK
jgi:hypothetical protein